MAGRLDSGRIVAMEGHPPGRAGRFNEAYEGRPPWDIGRAQGAIVLLEDEGEIKGSVLDAGCGTGENALFLSSRAHEVWGVDGSRRAIEKAQEKARERGLVAAFVVGDALHLETLGRAFDSVIDVGLFHSFNDEERARFASSLRSAVGSGGRYFVMVFSEKVKFQGGPRRVTQDELRATFRDGFKERWIRESHFETSHGFQPVPAWLGSFERAG